MQIKSRILTVKYLSHRSVFTLLTSMALLPCFSMDDWNMSRSEEDDKQQISIRKRYRPSPQDSDPEDNSPLFKKIKLLPVENIDTDTDSNDDSMDPIEEELDSVAPQDLKVLAQKEFDHAQHLKNKRHPNKKKAHEYYERSARHGNADAQYIMGEKFQKGLLAKRNSKVALKWFTLAATNGHADAQYRLGCKYQSRQGKMGDYKQAHEWFARAANQNHPEAQYCLGFMHQNGQGTKKDAGLALHWYSLAYHQGHEKAQQMINTVGTEDHLSASPPEIITQIFLQAKSFNMGILCLSRSFRDTFTKELRGTIGLCLKTEISLPEMEVFFQFIHDWPKIQKLNVKIPFIYHEKNSAFFGLRNSLANNTTLTALTIMGGPIENSLGNLGAKKIAEGLRENKKLLSLNISYNQIGYEGIVYIADILKYNTTLTELNLDLNDINDKGSSHLWKALSQNSTLKTLSLRNNLLGKNKQRHEDLATMLLKNTALHTLNLCGNYFHHNTVILLAEALKTNTSLTSLNLSENRLNNEAQVLLSRSQEVSETLQTLILKGDFDDDYDYYNNLLWEIYG